MALAIMIEPLILRPEHWEEMRAHIASCAPLEGCGLLAGTGRAVSEVFAITNEERSPVRFRMSPVQQLQAFDAIEKSGMELLGIFHSHPGGEANGTRESVAPSEIDVREAAYSVVQLIWSRRGAAWNARGFWIEDGKVTEVPLLVSTGG